MKVYIVEIETMNGPWMYEDTDIFTTCEDVFSTREKAEAFVDSYSHTDDEDVTITELRSAGVASRKFKWESPDYGEITYTLYIHEAIVR